MDNQQLYNLDNNQLQVLLTGRLGDGHLTTPKNNKSNSYYCTNCKYEEYILFKKKLLGNLSHNYSVNNNNGFSNSKIFTLTTKRHKDMTTIKYISIKEILNTLDNLGIALWFYDDGSLHKDKMFYNLNTHKFSKEIQERLFIPFFNNLNIFPKITKESKKDGRVFYYLRISKFEGSYEINKILEKYPIDCYKYKLWSSEAIQKWSKLQVELKHRALKVSNKRMSNLLKLNSIEDMVQSLEKSKAGLNPA